MRAFVLAVVAMAVIAVGAYFALQEVGFSTADEAASPAVRLE